MKFGIITLVSDNYGNKYQNYAVEQLLSEYGEVVTYQVEERTRQAAETKRQTPLQKLRPAYIREVLRCRLMYRYDITNTERSILGSLFYVLMHKKALLATKQERNEKFLAYQCDFLHISDRIITHDNCMEPAWINSHDLFICGSDQIWNPTYATTSDLVFLSFARGKAVALAPSFGLSELPENVKDNYRDWLNGIDVLSVREDAGAQIIRQLTGREAQVLLDPTMALETTQWKALAKAPKMKLPEKYIATYFLGRVTKEYHKRIQAISKKTGLPVIELFNVEKPDYYAFDPNEVLYTIANAELMLTDSFHGTVFSILFHRNFWVFPRDEGGMSMHSRLATLLTKMGLTDRLITDNSIFVPIEESAWVQVDALVTQERKKTKGYLQNALSGI